MAVKLNAISEIQEGKVTISHVASELQVHHTTVTKLLDHGFNIQKN